MQHVQPQTAAADAVNLTALAAVVGRLPGWPDQKIDALAALVASGLSYGRAADALGVSRNSTLGLAHRRRAAGDMRFGDGSGSAPRERRPAKPAGVGHGTRATTTPRPVADAVRLRGLPLFCSSARSEIRLPAPLGLSIIEVGSNQCRHMCGGFDSFRCCGAPTDGSSWCPAHRQMLYAGT